MSNIRCLYFNTIRVTQYTYYKHKHSRNINARFLFIFTVFPPKLCHTYSEFKNTIFRFSFGSWQRFGVQSFYSNCTTAVAIKRWKQVGSNTSGDFPIILDKNALCRLYFSKSIYKERQSHGDANVKT